MIVRRVAVVCLLVSAVAACGGTPTSPAINAPTPIAPANGTVVSNAAQPVTLTITNSSPSPSGSVMYRFEIATDAAFTAIVLTRDVPPGTAQTSVTLETLPAGRDYYWRARPNAGTSATAWSAVSKFTLGAAVSLGSPQPVSPVSGATAEQRPTLLLTNASHAGPVGAVAYRFEIASTSSFATLLVTGTVPEGSQQTAFTSPVELPANATFYWRAQAVDPGSGAVSGYSAVQAFTTMVSIDLTQVNFQRFVDISRWPITNRIIAVDQDGGDGHMCINHEKRGQWPTSLFEDNPLVPIEATQWYFARINGQWYGGAGEWLRPGQICKEGQKSEDIGKDGTWGGPMDTWIPARGELVGYMISTPARAWPTWRTLDERSNVVVQPWVVNGVSTP